MQTTPPGDAPSNTHKNAQSYEQLHKPSSEFNTRDEYLEHELQIMQLNAGVLIYRLEITDLNLKTPFLQWRALLVKSLWWVLLQQHLQRLLV
ncbi:DUF3360 family protein [Pseudoalteromonas sp. B193]